MRCSRPLHLRGTGPDLAGEQVDEAARFYYPRLMLNPALGLQDVPDVELSCHLPAIGFLSTPSDLVRFAAALMDGRLLDPHTVAELQTPVSLESGESTGRALGWVVDGLTVGSDAAPIRIVGQGLGNAVVQYALAVETRGGQVAGGTATLLVVPEHRIAIAVVANVSGADNVARVAVRLAELFVVSVRPE